MRVVGHRREPGLERLASAILLAQGARFGESLAAMGCDSFIPKGIYRFAGHAAANEHQLGCIARGLAARARLRQITYPD